jgi:hypothetical protein
MRTPRKTTQDRKIAMEPITIPRILFRLKDSRCTLEIMPHAIAAIPPRTPIKIVVLPKTERIERNKDAAEQKSESDFLASALFS